MSSTAVLILLNCYIQYALIQILHKVQDLVAASSSMVAAPLSKTDFVLLTASQQEMECIHIQILEKKQTKISLT